MRATLIPFFITATFAFACSGDPADPVEGAGGTLGSAGGSENAAGGSTPGSGGAVDSGPECDPGLSPTSQLPLLSPLEYENTVSDLFGVQLNVQSSLAPDTAGSLDERGWDAFLHAAKKISADVMSLSEGSAALVPCTTEDQTCAELFVVEFGRRAFRRPLTQLEVERFLRLYLERESLTQDGTFTEAIELIVRAFLASPSFLTKSEMSINGEEDQSLPLSDWELAARLSYGLTASMPDEALFLAAEAGALQSNEEVLAQALRLLETEPGHQQVARFHRSFLQMDRGGTWTTNISRDSSVYPHFDPAQVPAMNIETPLFTEHVVYSGGSYQDLLTSNVSFINEDLAPLYDLDAADFGSDFAEVELDPERYAGVLTRIGFLMAHGSSTRTNPITRGAFIQKYLLCLSMPPPPADAPTTPLPTDPSLLTNRARVDAQTSGTLCKSCHLKVINPLGFAFEHYDAVGAYQVTENGEDIDSSGTLLIGEEEVEVAGAVDLMDHLARSPLAHRCYAESWVTFAMSHDSLPENSCAVEVEVSKMGEGNSLLSLMAGLTQSEAFRHRAVGPKETAP